MFWKNSLFFGLSLDEEQKIYVDSMFNNRLTIVNAKAGSGKTTLAVAVALYKHQQNGQKLLYTFNPTEEDKLGFLPGDLSEKTAPYIVPLKDALIKLNQDPQRAIFNESTNFGEHAWVYAEPHTYSRGTNKEGLTIILDEAQNWTKPQFKKFLTRIHDNCTVIVIGHTGQCDLPDPSMSGFQDVINHFKDKSYAQICTLSKNYRGQLARDADEL